MEKKLVHPLFFEDRKGKLHCIAEVDNITEAHTEIHNFCKAKNYTSYYTRMWMEDAVDAETGPYYRLTFDVGSWSEFFVMFFDNEQQAKQFCNIE